MNDPARHIGIAAVSAVPEAESPLPAIDSTRTLARAALREATRHS